MTKADTTDSVPERDRPVDEVEITEEMIEAGLRVVEEFYLGAGRYAMTDECLTRMFREMLGAAKQPSR